MREEIILKSKAAKLSDESDAAWKNMQRRRCLSEAGNVKRISAFQSSRKNGRGSRDGTPTRQFENLNKEIVEQNEKRMFGTNNNNSKTLKLKRSRKCAIVQCVEGSTTEENNNNLFIYEQEDIRKKYKRKSLPPCIQREFEKRTHPQEKPEVACAKPVADVTHNDVTKPEKTRKVKEKISGIKFPAFKMFSLPRRPKRLL